MTNAFMKSSSNSLHVLRKPMDIVASIKTLSSTIVASKCVCDNARNSCLNARVKSIRLMNVVLKAGYNEVLTSISVVEYSEMHSLILGPPLL